MIINDNINDRNIIVKQDGVVMLAGTSLHKEKKVASIGVTAIDSCGNLLQAFGTSNQFVWRGHNYKRNSNSKALKSANEKEWSKVQVLLDAKSLVEMLLKFTVSWEIQIYVKTFGII